MKKLLVFIPFMLLSYFMKAQPCPAITGFSVTTPSCFGLCNGSIDINYIGGTPPYVISWGAPISQTFVTAALTQSVSGICSGAYSVSVTDNNGCAASQFVNVSQPSNLSLMTTPDYTLCYGQSTQIAAFGQGGTPPYTYSWNPSSLVGGGPFTVTPISTTNYPVSLTDSKGCTVSPQVITVDVSPPLSLVGSSVTICDGATTVLAPVITSPGNGGPYSYNWSNSANTETISVTGNVASSPSTYTVILDDGCTIPQAAAVFTVTSQVCSGISELEVTSLSVYPNPGNASLIISDLNLINKIELSDFSGKMLLSENLNDHSYQLQLQDFAEGIYFVKVSYLNGISATKKIVVTH